MDQTDTAATDGFVYIATGSEFVAEAAESARRLRETMPEADIALLSDVEPDADWFDTHVSIPDPEYGFEDQILNLERSPYRRTVYLDTDIYVDEDISDLFQLMEYFDIGLAQTATRKAWDVQGVPDCFPEYNSGVMVYKTGERFSEFVSSWRSIHFSERDSEETMRNQPSLRKALYESDLRIATLPPEYNCRINFPGQVAGKVKVFHGRLTSVDGPGAGNYFDIERAVQEINRTDKPRTFTQLGGITIHTNREKSLFHRARLSYRMHGPRHVLVEGGKLLKTKLLG